MNTVRTFTFHPKVNGTTVEMKEEEKIVPEIPPVVENKKSKSKKINKVAESYNKFVEDSSKRKQIEGSIRKFERDPIAQSILELKMKKKNGEILTASIGDILKFKQGIDRSGDGPEDEIIEEDKKEEAG